MSQKYNVAILMGGQSPEHKISLLSASNVIKAIDRDKYNPIPIGIDVDGVWYAYDKEFVENSDDASTIKLRSDGSRIKFVPGTPWNWKTGFGKIDVDIVFPVLHGPKCEDGSLQGLLDLSDLPYVGAGVLGSAVGMDKEVMKRLLSEADIPIGKYISLLRHEKAPDYEEVIGSLGLPLFVKPANMGSSVGISKVTNKEEYLTALETAFQYDNKILIEEAIVGREIECAVLGNHVPEASTVGEVISTHNFYSYESKYIDSDGAITTIPADLPDLVIDEIRKTAIATYRALYCKGLGRVDVFYTEDKRILVNEINTLPGFTDISMYPKLWEASGLAYKDLISRLIELSLK